MSRTGQNIDTDRSTAVRLAGHCTCRERSEQNANGRRGGRVRACVSWAARRDSRKSAERCLNGGGAARWFVYWQRACAVSLADEVCARAALAIAISSVGGLRGKGYNAAVPVADKQILQVNPLRHVRSGVTRIW